MNQQEVQLDLFWEAGPLREVLKLLYFSLNQGKLFRK